MNRLFTLLFLVVLNSSIFAQNLTAKILDKENGSPVAYATIKTGMHTGVISNEEGVFTLNTNNRETTTITISCMGYQTIQLDTEAIKSNNGIIYLEAAVNQLETVYLSNKRPSVDSIMARVRRLVPTNYNIDLNNYKLFYRRTEHVDFEHLDFEIEKASHVSSKNLDLANKEFTQLSNDIISSNIVHFTDLTGHLHTLNRDTSKLEVGKVTKLLDHKSDFSLETVEEKAKSLVLKYLDTTKTYKVKTGIFKVEDSMSIKEEELKSDKPTTYQVNDLKYSTFALVKKATFTQSSFLNTLIDPKRYEYTLEDINYNNDELVYIIRFKPRRAKSKLTGTMVVNQSDFAITRVDYTYYKSRHGSKFNLRLILGVKYVENLSEGTYIFEKQEDNTYQPKYIKRIKGSYFYVNRDFKLIENTAQKNKIGFSFKIEGDNRSKEEFLLTGFNNEDLESFKTIDQKKEVPFLQLSAFDKSAWENEAIIEPLEEMKRFGREE
ncbi:carboxypeptidase-like regulatory domain-containing protein [Aestuariivivens sediminicola]|uniref:carboxypeptidase-like regulatory domain-containing protein n=1 Tax=Aestuariivivens sediminicola TaxID=2913560 RepID=UPI001F587316|nr:carboxypeptidase-like regulatory domain-containing protein [Aestuariivivens sediminicola]